MYLDGRRVVLFQFGGDQQGGDCDELQVRVVDVPHGQRAVDHANRVVEGLLCESIIHFCHPYALTLNSVAPEMADNSVTNLRYVEVERHLEQPVHE